jgi:hypothetical protein
MGQGMDAFQDQHWRRLDPACLCAAVVAVIIIDRLVDPLPRFQRAQVFHQMVDLLGCRGVIVDRRDQGVSLFLIGRVAVKTHRVVIGIFAEHHGLAIRQMIEQRLSQCGLAGSGPAGHRDEEGFALGHALAFAAIVPPLQRGNRRRPALRTTFSGWPCPATGVRQRGKEC